MIFIRAVYTCTYEKNTQISVFCLFIIHLFEVAIPIRCPPNCALALRKGETELLFRGAF